VSLVLAGGVQEKSRRSPRRQVSTGWLLKVRVADQGELGSLLDGAAYKELLEG